MRIVFMGTPEIATRTLQALIDGAHDVVAVYTRAPKPGGRRGLDLVKTPVHLLAETCRLTVLTPTSLRGEAEQAAFRAHAADVAIVLAYGLLLPSAILQAPLFGCLNLHGSLLPRWRGAAPIQRAIMAGDRETGVDLMRMEEGLDTGPVARRARLAIGPAETAGDLARTMAKAAARLTIEALPDLESGRLTFEPQPNKGACYARKIEKAETEIDWADDAEAVRNRIHGLSPSPGAYSHIEIGGRLERVRILRADVVEAPAGGAKPGQVVDGALTVACGRGALRIVEAQRPGRSTMRGEDLQRGAQIGPGQRFTRLAAPPATNPGAP